MNLQERIKREGFHTLLLKPVPGEILALFRMFFGSIMIWEVFRYYPIVEALYISPQFHFHFELFEFVHPWAGNGMFLHFQFMGLCALCMAIGLFYRLAATAFFIAFSSLFLMEQAKYLNHFYLVSLISFLMIFCRANACWSFDSYFSRKSMSREVPFWNIFILRAQLFIVYFYGGLAKLNLDWLAGEPMRNWLSRREHLPIFGNLVNEWWTPFFFSYSGLLFDLGIGFFLLIPKTRRYAIPFLVSFHLMNAWIFSIGIFPWFMIGATILFFDLNKVHIAAQRWLKSILSKDDSPTRAPSRQNRFALPFVYLYLLIQLTLPFRHLLYPGDVAWTEEGHKFSWRMKLRDKRSFLRFLIVNPETGETTPYHPRTILTKRQYRKMSTRPGMICEFATYLSREIFKPSAGGSIEVYALAQSSLNGRPYQWLVDPSMNFSQTTCPQIRRSAWIMPLPKGLPIGLYPLQPTEEQLISKAKARDSS